MHLTPTPAPQQKQQNRNRGRTEISRRKRYVREDIWFSSNPFENSWLARKCSSIWSGAQILFFSICLVEYQTWNSISHEHINTSNHLHEQQNQCLLDSEFTDTTVKLSVCSFPNRSSIQHHDPPAQREVCLIEKDMVFVLTIWAMAKCWASGGRAPSGHGGSKITSLC